MKYSPDQHDGAVPRAAESRPAIIEECARVCEQDYTKFDGTPTELGARFASAIRALAPGGQNAPYSILADGDRLRASLLAGTSPVSGVAPAPAEVAEGVGDAERVLARLNAYVDDVHTRTFNGHVGWIPLDLYDFEVLNKALRAAPSLPKKGK